MARFYLLSNKRRQDIQKLSENHGYIYKAGKSGRQSYFYIILVKLKKIKKKTNKKIKYQLKKGN